MRHFTAHLSLAADTRTQPLTVDTMPHIPIETLLAYTTVLTFYFMVVVIYYNNRLK